MLCPPINHAPPPHTPSAHFYPSSNFNFNSNSNACSSYDCSSTRHHRDAHLDDGTCIDPRYSTVHTAANTYKLCDSGKKDNYPLARNLPSLGTLCKYGIGSEFGCLRSHLGYYY